MDALGAAPKGAEAGPRADRKRHADAFYGPGPRYEVDPDSPEERAWWRSVGVHERDPKRCPWCRRAATASAEAATIGEPHE